MKRAQSMAQAAWSRPPLLSSWSCIGPRHRAAVARTNPNELGNSPDSSSPKSDISDPFLSPPKKTVTTIEALDVPLSSTEGIVWSSEIECSCSDEIHHHSEVDGDCHDGDDIMDHNTHEDRMTEVELWQQLEHELYDQTEGEEAEFAKEIREEEDAAIAEVCESESESSVPETKEVHRFFPPGKIMHIITLLTHELDIESDKDTENEIDNSQVAETKVGIFFTPRSLYSKLRLSQTMIADHFMPVYRRQIEKLIKELEKEESSEDHQCREQNDAILEKGSWLVEPVTLKSGNN